MHDREKSDGLVVPVKLLNNAQGGAAEAVEGSGPAKGNTASETRSGHGAGRSVLSELGRVRRVAATDKEARFTALLHHVDVGRLRAAYFALRPKAAPGVDGVTWADYGLDLEDNLKDLHARVHRGAYRARPSRRVYIPKPDGRLRPLGVAALEDKILQRALVEVLNAIYELGRAGARCRRCRRSVSPTRRSSPRAGRPSTRRRRTAGPQHETLFGRSGVNTSAPLATHEAEERVLGWQTKLHRWAAQDEQQRFGDVFNLVCDPATLLVA